MAEYMRDEYGKAYTLPGPFYDVRAFIAEAKRRGAHYFDADTTRYFAGRYHRVIAGAIMVDSVKREDYPRQYRLSVMDSRGHVAHVADPRSGALSFATLRQAVRAAERVAESCGADPWKVAGGSDAPLWESERSWGDVSAERQMATRIAEREGATA